MWKSAYQELKHAINTKPNDTFHVQDKKGGGMKSEIEMGEALFEEGKIEEAQKIFKGILDRFPKNTDVLNNLGIISQMERNFKAAEYYFKKVIEIDPLNINSIINLSILFQKQNLWEKSIEILEKCVTLNNAEIFNQLAVDYINIGEDLKAQKVLKKSLSVKPCQSIVENILKQISLETDNDEENNGEAQFYALLEQKENCTSDKAIKMLEAFLYEYPDSVEGHREIANLYRVSGDSANALKHYETMVKLEPSNYYFMKELAGFYHRVMKDIEKALKIYVTILAENTRDIDVLMALGDITLDIGEEKDANSFYSKIIEIDSCNIEARRKLEKIIKAQMPIIESDYKTAKGVKTNGLSIQRNNTKLNRIEDIRLKIISPSDFERVESRRPLWGDYWVKYELEKAFIKLGITVVEKGSDVILYFFGNPPPKLPEQSYNIVWMYSHPSWITPENLKQFDHIFCSSPLFIPKLISMGYDRVETMIGATSKSLVKCPKKFDIVFVGNPKGEKGRQIITDIGDTPYKLKVWRHG